MVALCISRKVKKSESKSQLVRRASVGVRSCVYPVKLKNLKANHNGQSVARLSLVVVYIP